MRQPRESNPRWERGLELCSLHGEFQEEELDLLYSQVVGVEKLPTTDSADGVTWILPMEDEDIFALDALAWQRADERMLALCTADDWAAFRNVAASRKKRDGQRVANGRRKLDSLGWVERYDMPL